MEITRVTTPGGRAGAYYVRIQAMGRKYNIPLDEEVDKYDDEDCHYILALDNGFPVATCRWHEFGEGNVKIGRVVVLEDYRGQHLGQKCVQAAEEWIREYDYNKIIIHSRVEAVGFYEKMGFTADRDIDLPPDTFPCVYVEKNLKNV